MGIRIGDVYPLLEDTQLAYYYHGLLYADGCFTRHTGSRVVNTISISLAAKDKLYVEKFAEFLGVNVHINKKEGNRQVQYRFSISDVEKVPILCNIMGCGSNKTCNPPDPQIFYDMDLDRRLSLCCGMIDGDGSISKGIIKIAGDKDWLEVIRAMFNGLYSSCKLDTDGYTRCILGVRSAQLLYEHAIRHNLPIFDRKWQNKIKVGHSRRSRSKDCCIYRVEDKYVTSVGA